MNIKKSPYRPLSLVLFIYDFFRLFFMLELLIAVIPLGDAPEASWFPYLVYAAPNALFPLMGIFLLSRPGEYKSYISLYMAGKIIVIVSVFGWTIFSFQSILNSAFPAREFITIFGFLFGLIILDAASLLANSQLKNKLNRNLAEPSGETGEGDMVPEGRNGA
jgi:hypothetical protein